MNAPLQRLISKLSALLLLVGAIFVVVAFGAMPVYSHVAGLRAQIEQERATLGRLQSLNDDATDAQRIERLTADAKSAHLFVDGESDAIRLANLQSQIGGIAAAQGVKLRSSRNLQPRERNDVRYIGVQLQFPATMEQLQKIMTTIEAQRPYLFIETLQVTPTPGALAAGGEDAGQLETRMEIYSATPRTKG